MLLKRGLGDLRLPFRSYYLLRTVIISQLLSTSNKKFRTNSITILPREVKCIKCLKDSETNLIILES